MLGWLRAGPVGFLRRVVSYRSLEVARIVQRNLKTICTPTHASGSLIAIPELGIIIDPFRNEEILKVLPNLVSLKQKRNASFQMVEGVLRIDVSGVSVLTETKQDILFVHEVFDTSVYALELGADVTVWDVGANIGASSVFFAGCRGWKVLAYEPFPQTAEVARRNIDLNGLGARVQLVVAGIAGAAGKVALDYHHDWRGGNGLFGNLGHGDIGAGAKVEVEILEASAEFEKLRVLAGNDLIFAKIDCEGAEYEILRRLRDTGDLSRISVIVLEVHPIPNEDPEEPKAILLGGGMSIIRHERLGDDLQMIYAVRVAKAA